MSSIQSWREIILCAVSLEPVYTAAFNRSFSTQTHHDTVKYCLYTDTSMSLQAEPCYNKIQGYTVARCCQTPSELHLKDLVVFCSPDMIKLELQIESPTAKVHMLLAYCSCYTDWRGLFIKIKANQEEKSHSSLFLLLFCFHPSFKSMSFTASHFKVQIERALIIWRCNFDRSLLSCCHPCDIRCFFLSLSISDKSLCIWPRATASAAPQPLCLRSKRWRVNGFHHSFF